MYNGDTPKEVDLDTHSGFPGGCQGKLLVPGWAGELDGAELAYIKSRLRGSASLRRLWGFRPSAKRLSSAHIRWVAMYGVCGCGGRVLASVKKNKPRNPMKNTGMTGRAEPLDTKSAHPDASKGKSRPDRGPRLGECETHHR